jgi:hypothetical protein
MQSKARFAIFNTEAEAQAAWAENRDKWIKQQNNKAVSNASLSAAGEIFRSRAN